MNTAATEWAAKVAARNEIETAKARVSQPTFDWTGTAQREADRLNGKEVEA